MAERFVCVLNRNRDNYQVPLALHEAGVLERLVTDFYAPRWASAILPEILLRRRIDGLPENKVVSVPISFAMQAAARVLRRPVRPVIDRINVLHANRAAELVRSSGQFLYAYANYVPDRGRCLPGTRIIDFEFHPHPDLTRAYLSEDAARYPEVAVSFAEEMENLNRTEINNAWRRSDAIVCASSMTRRSLEHAGCTPEKISVIPYGFAPQTAPTDKPCDGTCRFLFVGQGIQRKGLHHLIRAWQASPPPDSELTIVCYRVDPGIAALARDPSIRLLGYQDRPALDALYAASDIFVMPSLIEGFGLAYLEAMAAGCHVIGTTNTGLPDLELGSEAATIIEPGDLEGLAAAMRKAAISKLAEALDEKAIAHQAAGRPWSRFRKEIADHARQFLADHT